MNRVVENGFVAVIVTSTNNTQWYTNHKVPELVFDPIIVDLVRNLNSSPLETAFRIERYCDEKYGDRTYYGDAMYLKVDWVPVGNRFSIIYEDGWECIVPPYGEVFGS